MGKEILFEFKDYSAAAGFAFGAYGLTGEMELHTLWIRLIISINIFFGYLLTLYYISLYQDRKNRFSYVHEDDGNYTIDDIKNAKSTIYVTHFSNGQPNEEYIQAMIKKIKAKIVVHRFIPDDIDMTQKEYKWLSQFKEGEFYKLIKIRTTKLHFDLLIIDDSVVKIKLPNTEHNNQNAETIRFENTQVAIAFGTMLRKIERSK